MLNIIALGNNTNIYNTVQSGPESFLGLAGIASAVIFASIIFHEGNLSILDIGSAYGTAKASVGICSVGINKPSMILKSIVPIIMAGILGVYGLIVGVILITKGLLNNQF